MVAKTQLTIFISMQHSFAIKKYLHIFSIGFSDMLAWRVGFLMVMLGTAASWLVMLIFWQAVYASGSAIGGYTLRTLVMYYTFVTVIRAIVDFSFVWDMATSLHEGQPTSYLVRPVSYLNFKLVHELGARFATLLALSLPLYAALWYFWGDLPRSASTYLSVVVMLVVGYVLVVLIGFIVAMCSIFFENPFVLTTIFFSTEELLSGRIIPLSIMPPWLALLAQNSPFRFVGGSAVEILLGTRGAFTAIELWSAMAWIAVFAIGAQLAWKYAALKYEAGGI